MGLWSQFVSRRRDVRRPVSAARRAIGRRRHTPSSPPPLPVPPAVAKFAKRELNFWCCIRPYVKKKEQQKVQRSRKARALPPPRRKARTEKNHPNSCPTRPRGRTEISARRGAGFSKNATGAHRPAERKFPRSAGPGAGAFKIVKNILETRHPTPAGSAKKTLTYPGGGRWVGGRCAPVGRIGRQFFLASYPSAGKYRVAISERQSPPRLLQV